MNRIVLTLAMMLPMVCPVGGHIPDEAEAEESNFSGGMWPSAAEQVAALPKLNKAPSPTAEEKEQGFIVRWPDYSLKVFEENPPAARGSPNVSRRRTSLNRCWLASAGI